MQFDWDDANRDHIALHGIEPEEAEDAVLDEFALDFPAHRGPNSERRFGVLGRVNKNLILVVILEEATMPAGASYGQERGDKIRVITARAAEKKERIYYEKTNH